MTVEPRTIQKWFTSPPVHRPGSVLPFDEPPSEKLAWLRLRQLADIRDEGLNLLGSNESRYLEFRNFIRQGRTYWDAAKRTVGSASALLYYYAMMNLAKAELLVVGDPHPNGLNHGLVAPRSSATSIRPDTVKVAKGVFPMLYRKRTGRDWPTGLDMNVLDLLSLVPELGHEMNVFGRTRPSTMRGYRAIAANDEAAWGVIGVRTEELDETEPVFRLLLSTHDRIALGALANWRSVLGLSTRFFGSDLIAFQSRMTFSSQREDAALAPDYSGAGTEFNLIMGNHIDVPIGVHAEFLLTPTLGRDDDFVLPLGLVRYAIMFYLSSLVRYRPASLDPENESAQAWLMDSFVTETALPLLIGMADGITGKQALYSDGYRS